MTKISENRLTVADLHKAVDRTVYLPAVVGHHLARGCRVFGLIGISDPHPNVGNDAFTEVYFTTASGNLYHIFRMKDGYGEPMNKWLMVNTRDNVGVTLTDKLKGYVMSVSEMWRSVLAVGKHFTYGSGGMTTRILAILAVNANRCYSNFSPTDTLCDIKSEFTMMCES